VRTFIGTIKSIEKLDSIRFSIDNVYEEASQYPLAVPLGQNVRKITLEEKVIILQPNIEIPLYYYSQIGDDKIELIWDKDHYINITKVNSEFSINLKCGKSTIVMTSESVLINDHLEVLHEISSS